MIRAIKVLSTVGESGTIDTNITTFGELKPLLSDRGINYSGMKAMVGETRNELAVDEAVLPEGDFKLYLMPAKTKSGSSARSRLYDTLSETYAELAELEENEIELVSKKSIVKEPAIDSDMADLMRLAKQEAWV